MSLDIRNTYQGFSVPILDAFYIMLSQAIYKSEVINSIVTEYERLTLDEMYSSLSRNPLLVLLRIHLMEMNKGEMKKIVSAARLYLINQVLIKY